MGKKIYKIGMIGAGNMGSGIAQKLAQEGMTVVMVDTKDEFVQRGMNLMKGVLQEAIDRRILTEEQVAEVLSRVHGTTDLNDVADCDLVIEAIFEDLQVKKDMFAQLDKICEPKTILASNTSSFYIKDLAAATNRPDRVIGMHYFFHPAKNRLLEIVPHEGTSQETIDKVQLIAKLHSKTAILVKDAPGFTVNRIFIPWYVNAIRIYEAGIANIPSIDAICKKAFGIGMGPFELQNVSGIAIGLHAARTLAKERGSFYHPPETLRVLVEDKNELFDLSGEVDLSKTDEVLDWMFGAVFGVACTMIDEGIARMEDIDRGTKIGLTWRKGPFELMNEVGIDKAYEMVKKLSEKRDDFPMPKYLEEQKKKGVPFELKFVESEIKDGIAYITINRPEAMNALNPTVVDQLEKNFDAAEKNPEVKAIVLQGAGKAFIAGADIKFFVDNIKNNTVNKTYDFTRKGHDLLLRLENSPKMTIALLDGLSLGGGSEVALACQAIVATDSGSFGFPETGIGICPGLGGMIRMERHVGKELTKYFTFTGKTFSAAEAKELGIVTKLVDRTETDAAIKEIVAAGKFDKYAPREIPAKYDEIKKAFSDENAERLVRGEKPEGVSPELAEKLVKIIAKKAPIAIREANNMIDALAKVSIKEAIEIEMDKLYYMFGTEDALAGLSSPTRPPKYQGK
ncbi:MAG TPA: 3-hydroxyacyl-CoA dehydrogenase/enoyl-CoA hydratase family protein [Firmicutes bacterium]|nr:3-hydroxyacyl-CoA dehydrogenase/enoyl-CoA hydratase family protein [Bacillota bacterium]